MHYIEKAILNEYTGYKQQRTQNKHGNHLAHVSVSDLHRNLKCSAQTESRYPNSRTRSPSLCPLLFSLLHYITWFSRSYRFSESPCSLFFVPPSSLHIASYMNHTKLFKSVYMSPPPFLPPKWSTSHYLLWRLSKQPRWCPLFLIQFFPTNLGYHHQTENIHWSPKNQNNFKKGQS